MKNYIKIALTSLVIMFLIGCDENQVNQQSYAQCTLPENSTGLIRNGVFAVSPTSIKKQLFSANTSVLLGINKVHQAKEQINLARARLYPSINLNQLLFSNSMNTFTATAVEILFPFLVPARWSEYDQSKENLTAQLEALKIIRMNNYASVYTMYVNVLSDMDLIRVFEQEVQDLVDIEKLVNNLYKAGLSSKMELDRIQGQKKLALVNLSKIKENLVQVKSSMKHMLGLPSNVDIIFTPFNVRESSWESKNYQAVAKAAEVVSPEMKQMLSIAKAAEYDTWSSQLAFIGGGSIKTPSGITNNQSAAFDDTMLGISFNIGYSQVPLIALSKERQKEIAIRLSELKLEILDRSETSLLQVLESKERLGYATDAKLSYRSVYERDYFRYQMGLIDLFTVLESRNKYRDAIIENLRSKTQLSLNRIVLHRLLLTDNFKGLEKCKSEMTADEIKSYEKEDVQKLKNQNIKPPITIDPSDEGNDQFRMNLFTDLACKGKEELYSAKMDCRSIDNKFIVRSYILNGKCQNLNNKIAATVLCKSLNEQFNSGL